MYVYALGKVTSIIHDPTKGGTEVNVELTTAGDSGEPSVNVNVSAILPSATNQVTLDATVDAAVREALVANGVDLGPGRLLILGPRVL